MFYQGIVIPKWEKLIVLQVHIAQTQAPRIRAQQDTIVQQDQLLEHLTFVQQVIIVHQELGTTQQMYVKEDITVQQEQFQQHSINVKQERSVHQVVQHKLTVLLEVFVLLAVLQN